MAVVALTDIYEPLTFNAAVDEAAIEKNAFIQSGVLVESPMISEQAAAGGRIGELPFYKNMDTATEPDYATDNPAVDSVPQNITDAKMIWRLAAMHGSWSTMDLSRQLALKDPLGAITEKIGGWWATQKEKRIIQTCMGIYADNDANDGDDMIKDIFADIAVPLAANIISAEAVLDARQTAGDRSMDFTAIAMHSVTFNTLNKQNLIDYIPNSDGKIDFARYLNMVVIVDDSLPAVGGAQSVAYTTILFQPGAFEHGFGRVMVPSEIERKPSAGSGGGQDILHSRANEVFHPYGFQFTSNTVTNTYTPTLANLALAVNWDRVVDRKLVGMAFLRHNN